MCLFFVCVGRPSEDAYRNQQNRPNPVQRQYFSHRSNGPLHFGGIANRSTEPIPFASNIRPACLRASFVLGIRYHSQGDLCNVMARLPDHSESCFRCSPMSLEAGFISITGKRILATKCGLCTPQHMSAYLIGEYLGAKTHSA